MLLISTCYFCCQILQYLQSFIKDNERKIELAKKRLEMQEKNPELEAKVCNLNFVVLYYGGFSIKN